MGAIVRTGKRENGVADSKVLGAYGRDEVNNHAERLLHATGNKFALLNAFFAMPNRGVSYTFQSANKG